MPCTPRTADGRIDCDFLVYPAKDGSLKEVRIGDSLDVMIKGEYLVKCFKKLEGESFDSFPEKVHIVMNEDELRVSDVFEDNEVVVFEFFRDDLGWKMKEEYDDLGMWMALFRGLMKDEINLVMFYESRAREGLYD